MDCLPLLLYLAQLVVFCQGSEDNITKINICALSPPVERRQIVKHGKNSLMCDTVSDGGGWLIFQRRINGDVSFERNWQNYTEGFGHLAGDFWLGLDNLHMLCNELCKFRVDISYKGNDYFNQYGTMSLSDASDDYRLHLSDYSGGNTPRHDLTDRTVSGMTFTTKDRDNDRHCAYWRRSGWWWNDCGLTNLNGIWGSNTNPETMHWESVTGYRHSVSMSELKVKVTTDVNKWLNLKTSHLVTKNDDITSKVTKNDDVTSKVTENDDVTTTVRQNIDVISTETENDDAISRLTEHDDVTSTVTEKDDVASIVAKNDDVTSTVTEKDDVASIVAQNDDVTSTVTEKDDVTSKVTQKDDVLSTVTQNGDVSRSGDGTILYKTVTVAGLVVLLYL